MESVCNSAVSIVVEGHEALIEESSPDDHEWQGDEEDDSCQGEEEQDDLSGSVQHDLDAPPDALEDAAVFDDRCAVEEEGEEEYRDRGPENDVREEDDRVPDEGEGDREQHDRRQNGESDDERGEEDPQVTPGASPKE